MSKLFSRSTVWIVDRPKLTLILLVLFSITAVGGYQAPRLFSEVFGTDLYEEDDGEDSSTGPKVDTISLANADAVLLVESDDIFTPQGAQTIRAVVTALEELPQVDRVLWLEKVPVVNIFGLPEPLLPSSEAEESRFTAAKKKALEHPLVRGQMLSLDGKTMLIMIYFDFLMIESDEDCREALGETARNAAASFDGAKFDFLVTGPVPTLVTAIQSHKQNQFWYQLVGYGVIAIMSIILFRGVAAVLVVACAPAIGVFWTLGIIRYFEFNDNPFNDVVLPVLISLVGLTDGVHLMVQIRRNRADGMSPLQAARSGIEQVGLACALTSLTTAIGFGSLSLANHVIVQEFGWSCVIGVTLTFIAVITTIPLACCFSPIGNRIHIGHGKGIIDKNLARIGVIIDWVLKHTRVLSTTGIVTTLFLIGLSLTLRPDEKRESALPLGSEAALAIRKLDQSLGGLEFGAVNIVWSEQVRTDSREVLDVISRIDQFLEDEPLIGTPVSIRTLLGSLPGDGRAEDRMSMLELLPPPLKRAFYTPESRSAVVSFRVQDLGIAAYGPVFERLQQELIAIKREHPEFNLELSGDPIWRWENLYQIVVDLATSLGTAIFIIFVVLSFAYRSLRIGIISMIPNLFPLAVAGSYLVVTGQNLEIVMVCAFTVCLGIAVDDTIHFLTRYLVERKSTADEATAIRRAFVGVGTALIMTTVILVAGLSTVISSDSRDHYIFATLGAITVGSALFGDLIFLPAILNRFSASSSVGESKPGKD